MLDDSFDISALIHKDIKEKGSDMSDIPNLQERMEIVSEKIFKIKQINDSKEDLLKKMENINHQMIFQKIY